MSPTYIGGGFRCYNEDFMKNGQGHARSYLGMISSIEKEETQLNKYQKVLNGAMIPSVHRDIGSCFPALFII